MTTFFYLPDYAGEAGYGLLFNLDMQSGGYVATRVSPKPAFMALAAMTRLLDGAHTLGRVNLGPGIYAYLFLREGQDVLAAWSPGQRRQIELRSRDADLTLYDMMGAPRVLKVRHGVVPVALDDYPVYLTSAHALQAKP
jgi:hypothetical protein